MTRIGAVVVHHDAYPGVLSTIDDLLREGIEPDAVVVVDNSDDADVQAQIRGALDDRVTLRAVPNRGYAHAANLGVAQLGRLGAWDAILVVTHEVRIRAGAVRTLSARLDEPTVGAVGPLLMDASRGARTIWSAGGDLSRRLMLPSHRAGGLPESARPTSARDCDWLDGAMVLYRASVVMSEPLPEIYFLYFEEVDYHAQLRRAGWRVVNDPAAVATQSTSGVPAWYLGRNLQLFQLRNNGPYGRVLAVPSRVPRAIARVLLGRDAPRALGQLVDGWIAGWRLGRRDAASTTPWPESTPRAPA